MQLLLVRSRHLPYIARTGGGAAPSTGIAAPIANRAPEIYPLEIWIHTRALARGRLLEASVRPDGARPSRMYRNLSDPARLPDVSPPTIERRLDMLGGDFTIRTLQPRYANLRRRRVEWNHPGDEACSWPVRAGRPISIS